MMLLQCWRHRTALDELARGGDQGSVSLSAQRHFATCARCAGRNAERRALSRALAAVSEESASDEAPARLEAVLVAALRRQKAQPPRARSVGHPSRRRAALVPALAATAALALAAHAVGRRPTAAPSPRAEAAAPETFGSDFMPLAYADDRVSLEGGQVVRVRVPRAALLSLGWPLAEDEAPETMTADVLLGHDGVARAIRFVR
jgi:hypothetical protein